MRQFSHPVQSQTIIINNLMESVIFSNAQRHRLANEKRHNLCAVQHWLYLVCIDRSSRFYIIIGNLFKFSKSNGRSILASLWKLHTFINSWKKPSEVGEKNVDYLGIHTEWHTDRQTNHTIRSNTRFYLHKYIYSYSYFHSVDGICVSFVNDNNLNFVFFFMSNWS